MASFNESIQLIAEARKASANAAFNLYQGRVKAFRENTSLSAVDISSKVSEQLLAEKTSKEALRENINQLYATETPQSLFNNLDANVPVLLLPVRLETAFIDTTEKKELWLRIYPDDIAVQQHETVLSEKEFEQGKFYWQLFFESEKNPTESENHKKAAWENIRSLFGPNRSAWVAKQTVPVNWANRAALTKKEELQFPEVQFLKPDEWTKAPTTSILPDKFIVSIFKGETKVHEQVGNFVPDTLFLGQDPFQGAEAFTKTESGIEFGKDFSWMANFEEAIAVGMAMKIELKDEFYLNPAKRLIDKIVVLGVLLSKDGTESASSLDDLLENHRYTEGLAIIPQGTPTNNTEEAAAGYIPNEDPQPKGYYEIPEVGSLQKDPFCDANRLVSSLNINSSTLEGIAHDTSTDHLEAVTMNSALFPATIGYYFDTLMENYVLDKFIPLLSNFFENYVTGAGPLPAIRVGDQPYGILVSSDFPNFKSADSEPDQQILTDEIHRILRFFSAHWAAQSQKVLYVGQETDQSGKPLNSDDVFLNVVGLAPSSTSFERRTGYLNDLPMFQTEQPEIQRFKSEAASHQTLISNQFREFSGGGSAGNPMFSSMFFRHENRVHIPEKNLIDGLTQDSESLLLPDIAEIGKNYLQWLSEITSVETLEKQDLSGGKAPNFLLYLLARHSLLLELRKAALNLWPAKKDNAIHRGTFDRTYLNYGGFFSKAQRDLTIWEILHAELAKVGLTSKDPLIKSLGDFLLNDPEGPGNAINQLKNAIVTISKLPTARLERLLTGHLDCLTYRLDAWQTGLFFKKLDGRRKDQAAPVKGTYLGAYGYVENLMPTVKQAVSQDSLPDNLKPADGTSVFKTKDNAGLIQAPSLDHAAAAALLMTGYRNHATPQDPGAFAVNISSSRTRKATQILQGIRNDQSLEALLGYQFERSCHERTLKNQNLNQFILAFRNKYPIENQYDEQEGESDDTESFRKVPPVVVNGLTLSLEKNRTIFADIMRPVVSALNASEFNNLFDAVVDEVENLNNTLDAVKDLLMSETVFQAAAGNTARTGAVLEALREGSLPPEPGILKTPRRSRFSFNQLIAIHFPQTESSFNPWGSEIPLSPRSQFEPGLNSWIAELIGQPQSIVCEVNHTNSDTDVVAPMLFINLLDLKIQPVDFFMMVSKEIQGGISDLEKRIIQHYRLKVQTALQDSITVDLEAKNRTSEQHSFANIITLLKAFHTTFAQARAIHAADYSPYVKGKTPQTENPHGYPPDELENRITACNQLLASSIATLDSVVPNDEAKSDQNPDTLNVLFKQWETAGLQDDRFDKFIVSDSAAKLITDTRASLSCFDIPGALPDSIIISSPEDRANFLASTARIWRSAHGLLESSNTELAKTRSLEKLEDKIDSLSKLAKLLLGGNFPVMPTFTHQNADEIKSSITNQDQLLKYFSSVSGLPAAIVPENWFQSVAAVREKTNRWELARSLAEIQSSTDLGIHVIQLPFRPFDSWLAVEFPQADENGKPFSITTDTISCSVFGKDAGSTNGLQSGLLIDEWSETIPVDTETTGIAFHYNQPDVVPPQALLLAISPSNTPNWSWDALLSTVTDTFKRSKMRAVEPLHFENNAVIRHFLPGVIAPVNITGNNISLDFAITSDEFLKRLPRDLGIYTPFIKSQ